MKFVQVAKDGNICLFYAQKAEIYIIGDDMRKRYNKPYTKPENLLPNSEYNLFIVPDSFENIINVFFEEKIEGNNKTFTLWCIEFEFVAS